MRADGGGRETILALFVHFSSIRTGNRTGPLSSQNEGVARLQLASASQLGAVAVSCPPRSSLKSVDARATTEFAAITRLLGGLTGERDRESGRLKKSSPESAQRKGGRRAKGRDEF